MLVALCSHAAIAATSQSSTEQQLSWLAAEPPTQNNCSVQHACPSCIAAGCAWCISSQTCVSDQLGACDGGPEDHVGFVSGQRDAPRQWMCDSDLGSGPVIEAAGECLAMAQLGGLHRPISVGCVRVETSGWLQIYTKVKDKPGWRKRWCELQSGFTVACGKTPSSVLVPRIDLTNCKSLAPSHVPGAKKGELVLSCASGMRRLHGVTDDGQKRWVRALITSLTALRCQDALQSEVLRSAFAEKDNLVDKKHGELDEMATYARLGATAVRYPIRHSFGLLLLD